MADDLLVLLGALKTLQITGLSSRYTCASNLVGGALLLRPELLIFP